MPVVAGKLCRDERGVALPTAMIVLVILMALTFAFSSLATTEPSISRNHSMAAQARGYAESGVELAVWALNNPAHASGIETVPAMYDGDDFYQISPNGGFNVAVAGAGNERTITAVGWAPDSDGQLHAAKKIQVSLTRFSWATKSPSCGLCIKGKLDVGGNAEVDARSNHCSGSTPVGGTVSTGVTTQGGSSEIYGPGNSTANEAADMPQNRPETEINYSLTADDLLILKSIAQANGTYYRGDTHFDSSNLLPANGGIVFVDTTTGEDLWKDPDTGDMTPAEEMGSVQISGTQTWSGWLIAMGDITVSGTVNLTGTIYARNDFVFNGNGTITGNVTGENKLGTLRSSVDASLGGSSSIVYHCEAAKNGGGTIASGWQIKPLTYREVDGTGM
jgi:hypothetical protein